MCVKSKQLHRNKTICTPLFPITGSMHAKIEVSEIRFDQFCFHSVYISNALLFESFDIM